MSEFPTTMAAAQRAHAHGLSTVAALDLARERVLDALSSDDVPSRPLQAAWSLRENAGCPLPEAVALISAGPSRACGLDDRGAIRVVARADLVRVIELSAVPAVREVWRRGQRVA